MDDEPVEIRIDFVVTIYAVRLMQFDCVLMFFLNEYYAVPSTYICKEGEVKSKTREEENLNECFYKMNVNKNCRPYGRVFLFL